MKRTTGRAQPRPARAGSRPHRSRPHRSRPHRAGRLVLALFALSVLVVAAACDRGGTPKPGGSTAPPSSPAAATTGATTAAPAPTGTGTAAPSTPVVTPTLSAWTTGPLRVDRSVPVPPVPQLVGIRYAAHPDEGFDRITFDFRGRLPGYELRYVSQVIADGSGQPVTVPGRRFLQIVFRPAQAHTDAGTPTVTERSKTLDLSMLRAYAINGDFEAVLSVALGLDDTVAFRVGELTGRIYVDVAA
jgi:hypothetical protein